MEFFTTERIAARRLTMDDAEAMQAIYGDREAMIYVGDGNPLTVENCRYWVEVTDGNFERRGYGMLAITDRQTGEVIACAGVVHPHQQEEPEIKYALRRDQWGKGVATEIVSAMLPYARDQLQKSWLMATVHPEHSASQNVLKKAGFRHEGNRPNDDGTVTQVWKIDLAE